MSIESIECTHCDVVGQIPYYRIHVILRESQEWLDTAIKNASPEDAKEIALMGQDARNFHLGVFTRGTNIIREEWLYVDLD